MKIKIAAMTDPGLIRAHNEDAHYVSSDQHLLVVADGMGGEVGGAVASKLAVETLENLWKTPPPNGSKVSEWMVKATEAANNTIFNVSHADPGLAGMGTTLIFAVLSDTDLVQVAHVGDSRAYLIRQDVIEAITKDHSTVQELVDAGKMSEQEARHSPRRHLLSRCVGYERQLKADITSFKVQANDKFLLCSDGLTIALDDEAIASIVNQCNGPDEICKHLIEASLKEGAPDNITVVAAEFAKV
jgi:protein phosphatase